MRDERDCPGARLWFCERMSQVASTRMLWVNWTTCSWDVKMAVW